MTKSALFAWANAYGAGGWQLGPLPPRIGSITLVGWRCTQPQAEGGVPEQVASILASAMASVARVTFADFELNHREMNGWTSLGGDLVRSLGSGNLWDRISTVWTNTPANVILTSTLCPEAAVRLFGAAAWWCMQGQVAIFSSRNQPPPEITRKGLLALFQDDWAEQAVSLTASGVVGVLRPGVDGALAGLWSMSDVFKQSFLAALENDTRQAGFEWAITSSEDDFSRRFIEP